MDLGAAVTTELIGTLAAGLQLENLPPEAIGGIREAYAAILEHADRLQGWDRPR